ncbi:DNA-binding transcriptional regulator, HxlR family [Escherichia coli]
MSQVSLSQQLKEGNLFAEQCPSREVLKHVTSRWGVLILVALREGTHRFSDLRRKIGGVSEKMLAQSLQALEQDGFLNRIAYPVVPPHVEYSLTPLGEQVSEKVAALADWIELNLPEVLAVRDERAALLPDALSLSGLRCMACRADKMRQHRIRQ